MFCLKLHAQILELITPVINMVLTLLVPDLVLLGIGRSLIFFLEKEDDPRPLHLDNAYGYFINY